MASAVDAGLLDFKQVARATKFTHAEREKLAVAVMKRIDAASSRPADLVRFRVWLEHEEVSREGGDPSWYVIFDEKMCMPDNENHGDGDSLWQAVCVALGEEMPQLAVYRACGGIFDDRLEHKIAFTMTHLVRKQMETRR